MEENPYNPPSSQIVEPGDLKPIVKETRSTRIAAFILALYFLALPLAVDFIQLDVIGLIVAVMMLWSAFLFGFIAVTGRRFSFKSLRRRPN